MTAKRESGERPKGFWGMLLWRPWTSDSGPGIGQERPADILRRRLASGEITP